jgi:hypothetical protein
MITSNLFPIARISAGFAIFQHGRISTFIFHWQLESPRKLGELNFTSSLCKEEKSIDQNSLNQIAQSKIKRNYQSQLGRHIFDIQITEISLQ